MTTATENTIPLTGDQVQAVLDAMEYQLAVGWYDGNEDADAMEARGRRLVRCAGVKRAVERAEFPVEDDALTLLGEFEKTSAELVDDSRTGLAEDLLAYQERLSRLRSIRRTLRMRTGGDA